MTKAVTINFARNAPTKTDLVVVLAAPDGKEIALPASFQGKLDRAVKAERFTGKLLSTIDLVAPEGIEADRLLLLGIGDGGSRASDVWFRIGGKAAGMFRSAGAITVIADVQAGDVSASDLADLATGIKLRAYGFDAYKTRRSEDDEQPKTVKVTIVSSSATAAAKAFSGMQEVAAGVELARDLVNEPANKLGPVEFAARASELASLGVKIEVLTEKEMTKLGMGALLGVAQGSPRGARIVTMRWNGGKPKDKPVAFVGKGVTFDTGGNSMKPASGMEDMKGDMGGAAAVTGLMRALAGRKAKANVVGVIGLVENAVDGNAQRPGDIVTSMSGQTIEVLNTDAEGRLVLADALWYCNKKFEPTAMIDLATLTGAIMVALGQQHAGLFSNNDSLAANLQKAGAETNEKLWRMPLGPDYDKLIESKNADMKNIGGRYGGAITAAQFLQRFVKDTPWAHLDIAGMAMSSPPSEYSTSWGSGFGVRLLNRFVQDNYE